jgi:hypothetical protein
MNRSSHTSDLLTLIGMMATIAGILVCLFFLFSPMASGAEESSAVSNRLHDMEIAMRWIQPILGHAIVEDALMRQHSSDPASTKAGAEPALKPAPGSVQWVLGRVIVELDRSRLVGTLPEDRLHDGHRIVMIARYAAAQFMEKSRPGA